jgi:single-strand DNA-binding protein
MSINSVSLSGNLTRDMELRQTPGGTAVGSFCIAVNERRKNQRTGEWEDHANFVDCTMFGRRAEALAPYLLKGTKCAVQGRLHYSSWEDRGTGQKRSRLDVTVDEVEFLSSRDGGRCDGGRNMGAAGAPRQRGHVQQQMADAYGDEDIPF